MQEENHPINKLAADIFTHYKNKSYFKKFKKVEREQSEENKEPELLKDLLNELVDTRSWNQSIAGGALLSKWPVIVGDEIATHSEALTLLDGKLTVRASSTAWATQLKLLTPEILRKIQKFDPEFVVDEIAVLGPKAPNWKRGLRTIKGQRGPRDTYG
jgi:predicted nucleic acid-binding Zn ribbon protein